MITYKIRFDRESFLSVNIETDDLFEKMGEDFIFLDGIQRRDSWVRDCRLNCVSASVHHS